MKIIVHSRTCSPPASPKRTQAPLPCPTGPGGPQLLGVPLASRCRSTVCQSWSASNAMSLTSMDENASVLLSFNTPWISTQHCTCRRDSAPNISVWTSRWVTKRRREGPGCEQPTPPGAVEQRWWQPSSRYVDIDEDHVRLNGHSTSTWELRESFRQPVGVVMILRQALDIVLQGVESGGR